MQSLEHAVLPGTVDMQCMW